MQRILASLVLLAALGAAHAQTIKITTSNGACTYPTGTVSSDPTTPGQLLATVPSGQVAAGAGCPVNTPTSTSPGVVFGPASPLTASATSLAGGANVADTFSVLPLNAVSCAAAIVTTSGTGAGSLTNGSSVCATPTACLRQTPFSVPATFTNTSTTTSSTYNITVTCTAAADAIPLTTASTVSVSQAAASSGGTPVANFTFTTAGLTATFTDTSTDTGGTIGTHAWTFGDSTSSTAANPGHTYAAAGTYSVTETVTDSANGTQSAKTQSVTVSVAAACPAITSTTAGITNFNRWTGTPKVYLDSGLSSSKNADITSFNALYGPWPGQYGNILYFMLPNASYLSMAFTVPNNYMTAANKPNPLDGAYKTGETGDKTLASFTISTTCGDFSNPATYPTTSTVLPGCWKNKQSSSTILFQWNATGSTCVLQNNKTYYLNAINADISQVQPNGAGTAASTKNTFCSGGTCELPIYNGPGTWSGYTPQ
jgi:PKD repeat protein